MRRGSQARDEQSCQIILLLLLERFLEATGGLNRLGWGHWWRDGAEGEVGEILRREEWGQGFLEWWFEGYKKQFPW